MYNNEVKSVIGKKHAPSGAEKVAVCCEQPQTPCQCAPVRFSVGETETRIRVKELCQRQSKREGRREAFFQSRVEPRADASAPMPA